MSYRLPQLALKLIKGVTGNIWRNLITEFGSADVIFKLNKSELLQVVKNSDICDSIINKCTFSEADEIIEKHEKSNVKIISYFDSGYPYRLKEIYDPPCFLYCKGNNLLNNLRMLSIIGTREPTNYGINNCKKFVFDLKNYDITVISGLAYGIDVVAHQEALNNNIPTLSVLAGGVDIIYPAIHKSIYDKIIGNGGCIISEFPNGTKHDKFRFPLRNRIIAGLSDGILVIEAGEKSGTEITALCGNEYNRDVFAIPGNINSLKSIGCNKLIKSNKALLVNKAQDIAEYMNWNIAGNSELKKEKIILSDESLEIYNFIKKKNSTTFDEIYQEFDIDTNMVSSILLKLELNNLIKSINGDKYSV